MHFTTAMKLDLVETNTTKNIHFFQHIEICRSTKSPHLTPKETSTIQATFTHHTIPIPISQILLPRKPACKPTVDDEGSTVGLNTIFSHFTPEACGISVAQPGSNSCPLGQEHEVLITELPAKSCFSLKVVKYYKENDGKPDYKNNQKLTNNSKEIRKYVLTQR